MILEIEPSVVSVIDQYMSDIRPLSIGYEIYCFSSFREACDEFFIKHNYATLVRIKDRVFSYHKNSDYSKRKQIDDKYDTYFHSEYPVFKWIGRGKYGYQYFLRGRSIRYFEKYANELCMKFVQDRYEDLEHAIMETDTFCQLWNQFSIWFDEKRKSFMENMEVDIKKVSELSARKTPQSHGGVANLLKVLTKTMENQGADIANIAKVQYAVCVQAGIYIPDEFIRDVAVSLEIQKEI